MIAREYLWTDGALASASRQKVALDELDVASPLTTGSVKSVMVSRCEILVANHESTSPQREMVEDLLAIVHTFSRRLHGLHRYEKQLKTDLAGNRL